FDGHRVDKLLRGKAVGESWTAREEGAATPKYQIKRLYRELGPQAQIGVLHPFSQGELYPEPLVVLDEVFFRAFRSVGFELVERKPFGSFLEEFKNSREGEQYHQLVRSPADLEYMQLYEAVVLRRATRGGNSAKLRS